MTNEKEKTKKKKVERKVDFREGLSVIRKKARVSALVADLIQNPPSPKSKKPKKTESSES